MKRYLLLSFIFLFSISIFSQEYEFKTVVDLDATDVISQGQTGTCWSFSTSSFLESEIIRLTGKRIDLSEMYTVRQTYPKKAWNYVMRQGKTQFSEGGLAHDVLNSVADHGLVPLSAYSGLKGNAETHNHSKMVKDIKVVLAAYIKESKTDWKQETNAILDEALGENITSFTYEGVEYTPLSFLEMTKIKPEDYVNLTSFTHKPQYSNFVLNIPDNFSNGSFDNVSLDELIKTIDNALKNGFTVELDCDVSEKTFSAKNSIAVVPHTKEENERALKNTVKELDITPELRQQEFENYNTTDDHLMHITGLVKDQNGTKYYKVKNSWGKIGNGGYIYMSEAYMRLKTISITLHKDALTNDLAKRLN